MPRTQSIGRAIPAPRGQFTAVPAIGTRQAKDASEIVFFAQLRSCFGQCGIAGFWGPAFRLHQGHAMGQGEKFVQWSHDVAGPKRLDHHPVFMIKNGGVREGGAGGGGHDIIAQTVATIHQPHSVSALILDDLLPRLHFRLIGRPGAPRESIQPGASYRMQQDTEKTESDEQSGVHEAGGGKRKGAS